MRVLGRLRLSRSTEESTSNARQREMITQWAAVNDHTVIGWAEDTDVSGSLDPFDTPQLGDWLGNRAPEFDVIACWKLDRLSRNAIKLNHLFGWCLEHDKTVVSCSESIDLSTPVGRLIANVIGFLAEGELEAIRDRQRGSKAKLRELGRWSGGKVPYGHTAVPLDGGGWSLEVDKDAAAVIRRIVDEFLDGRPLAHIAKGLNADGIPPSEVYRGRSSGESWHVSSIRNKLRSKSLLGYVHHQGETVGIEKQWGDTGGDMLGDSLNKMLDAGKGFAEANIKQFTSDIGIQGGGALTTLADQGIGFLTQSLSKMISGGGSGTTINVNSIDEALAAKQTLANKRALQFTNR